jgi:hypothetical protein
VSAREASADGNGAIALLALAAAAFVLAAPVAGNAGLPRLADAAMLLAAGSGIASFVLAALGSLRAARNASPPAPDPEPGDGRTAP